MAETQPVPESTATVALGLSSLRELPEGAVYRAKEGQASVELRRQGDEIIATGHCDSISRLCSFYFDRSLELSREVDSLGWELNRAHRHRLEAEARLAEAQEAAESQKKQPPNLWWPWVVAGGFAGGIAADSAIRKMSNNA